MINSLAASNDDFSLPAVIKSQKNPQIIQLFAALRIFPEYLDLCESEFLFFSISQAKCNKCMPHKLPRIGILPYGQEQVQSKLWVEVE